MFRVKRAISIALCLTITAAMFAACGSSTQPSAVSSGAASSASAADTPASSSDTLVIYNSNPEDWTAPIIKEFQEETGIKIELVGGNTGELHARVRAETENPLGDILWGGTPDAYMALSEYLEAYESTEKGSIRPEILDPNNAYYCITMDPYAIAYNTNLVTEDEAPRTWADLLDPKWKGKIALSDPTKSASTYVNMCIIMKQLNSDFSVIEQLIDNLDGKLANGSAAQIKSLADGEFAIALTYEESILRYINNGANMQIVYPEDGTQLSSGCFAIVKGAKNMENAKKFIDFALSKKVQEQMAQYQRRSVRVDVESTGMTPLDNLNATAFDLDWSAAYKEEFMAQWQAYVTR